MYRVTDNDATGFSISSDYISRTRRHMVQWTGEFGQVDLRRIWDRCFRYGAGEVKFGWLALRRAERYVHSTRKVLLLPQLVSNAALSTAPHFDGAQSPSSSRQWTSSLMSRQAMTTFSFSSILPTGRFMLYLAALRYFPSPVGHRPPERGQLLKQHLPEMYPR